MATANRKNPRDVTGRKAAELAEARAEEIKARQSEISTVTVAPDIDPDPYDDTPEATVNNEVSVDSPTKKLRVNVDLEDVTIGQGTNYNFYRGQTYTVPTHVYQHLEEKGCVWH
ncbi:hypothetical protein AB0G15_05335 [Streptosporangium sp. NPDC023825]|uniref:hypothetical protein n=1 Tax=Streptosporangium sp. NPDC023825 TaxID=3154909 RepID=UPI003442E721